jgi:hypothetical protein
MKKILKTLLLLGAFVAIAVNGAYAQISIGVSINVHVPPPALPVYVQPECPVDGYLWQPGYWAYSQDDDDYYWVPGVWVAPPNPGVYWTPPYWGYAGGVYGFHAGYWGPHVGFYGGINYGGGFTGVGFVGGEWAPGGGFRYNTAVVHVNTTVVHNTYVNNTVINNTTINNRNSFNGPGGVNATPTPQERAAMNERHIPPTTEQLAHQQAARSDKSAFSKVNSGRPAAVAMNRVNGTPFNARGAQAPATPQARQQALASRPNQPNNGGGANRNANGNANQPGNQQRMQQNGQPQNVQQHNDQPNQPQNMQQRNNQPQNNGQVQQQRQQQQAQQRQQQPRPQQHAQPHPQQPRPQPYPQQRPPEEHKGRP